MPSGMGVASDQMAMLSELARMFPTPPSVELVSFVVNDVVYVCMYVWYVCMYVFMYVWYVCMYVHMYVCVCTLYVCIYNEYYSHHHRAIMSMISHCCVIVK